ncbi:MAG TPA: AI-2E family transporter [Candidatus Cloacimonadota bacterium]|nr:AI-2E family transporter [Candidatus Cloacimonadota bacterium]HPT70766.1 AI-2E family transporter [Candidatus Cloacimonadota bacterium]
MTDMKWIRNCLIFISLALLVVCVKTLKEIFIPLFFAVFFTFLIAPLHRFLIKKKIPNAINIILITLILLIFIGLVIFLIYEGFNSLVMQLPKYESAIMNIAFNVGSYFGITEGEISNYMHPQLSYLKWLSQGSMNNFITSFMKNTFYLIMYILFMIIFVIFIIADHNRFVERIYQTISRQDKEITHKMLFKIENQVVRYLVNKTLICLGAAIVETLMMLIFGIDFPLVMGFITFIVVFIPTLGPGIAIIVPILIASLQYGMSWHVLAIAGSLALSHTLIGSIAEPKILGESLNLSPIIIIISLVFWAWIWGPIGMILAVPITSAMNIILKEFKMTKPFSEILSDPNFSDNTE